MTAEAVALVFDTETTGLPVRVSFNTYHHYSDLDKYNNSRVIQLSWLIVNKDHTMEDGKDFIINRRGQFNIENHHIHGVTNEMSDEGQDLSYALDLFKSDLEKVKVIVAHNLLFDLNILMSECYRLGRSDIIDLIEKKSRFCTMRRSRDVVCIEAYGWNDEVYNKLPKLSETYYHFFGENFENAHNALADATACAKCYIALRNKYIYQN